MRLGNVIFYCINFWYLTLKWIEDVVLRHEVQTWNKHVVHVFMFLFFPLPISITTTKCPKDISGNSSQIANLGVVLVKVPGRFWNDYCDFPQYFNISQYFILILHNFIVFYTKHNAANLGHKITVIIISCRFTQL